VTADRDEESGQFSEQYPRDAFIRAVDTIENATTKKVSEEVGCSYDLAYRRLKALEEQGAVTSTMIGSSLIWSR